MHAMQRYHNNIIECVLLKNIDTGFISTNKVIKILSNYCKLIFINQRLNFAIFLGKKLMYDILRLSLKNYYNIKYYRFIFHFFNS